jgi:hypothetical protein
MSGHGAGGAHAEGEGLIDARKNFVVCFEAPPPPKKDRK